MLYLQSLEQKHTDLCLTYPLAIMKPSLRHFTPLCRLLLLFLFFALLLPTWATALSAGEVAALKDMQAKWGLSWAGLGPLPVFGLGSLVMPQEM